MHRFSAAVALLLLVGCTGGAPTDGLDDTDVDDTDLVDTVVEDTVVEDTVVEDTDIEDTDVPDDSDAVDSDGTCSTAETCPQPDAVCVVATCDGVCGTTNADPGTLVDDPTPGDCQALACDGQGAAEAIPSDDDLPTSPGVCFLATCEAGMPSFPPAPPRTPCGGPLMCDGSGACVECTERADCGAGECVAGACVPP